MRRLLIAIVTTGCAVQQAETRVLDSQPLSDAITFSDPSPLVNLEDTLKSYTDSDCPAVEFNDGMETWSGGCETEAGLQIDGQLKMVSNQWIAANDFMVRENGKTLLMIDGGLEKIIVGDLLQLDFTGDLCGIHADDCASGLVQLELNASIYPLSDYPGEHDISVHGFINGDDTIGFDGSWSRDESSCNSEAADGVFGIWQNERHDLVFNGSVNCDACAEWRVQGSTAADYCGDLP